MKREHRRGAPAVGNTARHVSAVVDGGSPGGLWPKLIASGPDPVLRRPTKAAGLRVSPASARHRRGIRRARRDGLRPESRSRCTSRDARHARAHRGGVGHRQPLHPGRRDPRGRCARSCRVGQPHPRSSRPGVRDATSGFRRTGQRGRPPRPRAITPTATAPDRDGLRCATWAAVVERDLVQTGSGPSKMSGNIVFGLAWSWWGLRCVLAPLRRRLALVTRWPRRGERSAGYAGHRQGRYSE
jgi:hypothetical protein